MCTPILACMAVARRMKRADITVHGFRSTFRDWCAEATDNAFSCEVCELALAHSLPGRVEAAYSCGDLLDKRNRLVQAWADYCRQIAWARGSNPARHGARPARSG